ncbi:MAG: hypothetical protein O2904_05115 [bacterium]|nr:hypothetical protein [bacterium]
MLFLALGIVLLVIWAAKNMNAKSLKSLALGCIGVGLVGALAFGTCGKKFGWHGKRDGSMHNTAMMQALSDRGLDMTEEEMTTMMEEMKSSMKGGMMMKKDM